MPLLGDSRLQFRYKVNWVSERTYLTIRDPVADRVANKKLGWCYYVTLYSQFATEYRYTM